MKKGKIGKRNAIQQFNRFQKIKILFQIFYRERIFWESSQANPKMNDCSNKRNMGITIIQKNGKSVIEYCVKRKCMRII